MYEDGCVDVWITKNNTNNSQSAVSLASVLKKKNKNKKPSDKAFRSLQMIMNSETYNEKHCSQVWTDLDKLMTRLVDGSHSL